MAGVAGMRVLELANVAREVCQPYGVQVVEASGWQNRGYELASPDVALRHWTAGAPTGRFPSYGILLNGRTGLPGPLCNLAQTREAPGTLDQIYVIAGGKANHAGEGSWNGVTGNSNTLGLEIEWSGPNEDFSPQRKLVSELAMITLMRFCGANPEDACEHREWTTRKIDTNLDGNELRNVIRTQQPSGGPITPPTPSPEPLPPSIATGGASFAQDGRPGTTLVDQVAIGVVNNYVYHRVGESDPASPAFVGDQGWTLLGGQAKSVAISWSGPFLTVTAHGMDDAPHSRTVKHPGGGWSPWRRGIGQLAPRS